MDLPVSTRQTPLAKRRAEEAAKSRGVEVETMPLFLSDMYKDIYDRSKEEMEKATAEQTGSSNREDRKKTKASNKMYRAQWIQDKISQ